MLKSVNEALTALALVILVITIGSFSLIKIQGQPIWFLVRNMILAGLGEPTPGLSVPADEASQDTLVCDLETGECAWE